MFEWNQLVAIVSMMLGGALGGFASLLFARRTQQVISVDESAKAKQDGPASIPDAVLTGVAAAAVVPLLLAIAATGAQTSLVGQVLKPIGATCASGQSCADFVPSLALLVSFCVAAGAAGRSFVSSLSSYLVRRVTNLEEKTERLATNTEEAREIAQETASDAEAAGTSLAEPAGNARGAAAEALNDDVKKDRIRQALGRTEGRYRRALWSIALESGLYKEDTRRLLEILYDEGAVEKIPSPDDPAIFKYRLKRG